MTGNFFRSCNIAMVQVQNAYTSIHTDKFVVSICLHFVKSYLLRKTNSFLLNALIIKIILARFKKKNDILTSQCLINRSGGMHEKG